MHKPGPLHWHLIPTKTLPSGISHGFRIGFAHNIQKCIPASSNHPSALKHPEVINERLSSEIEKRRLIGPLDPSKLPYVQISSLGAIPKKHADKWRLILDLSHPKPHSVNDGIDRGMCSLSYMRVDDVVQQILQTGKGCLLAKVDIEDAFRNLPVHPHDRHLLGMAWENQLFVDTVLPFGLRSVPKIFNSIADALQWITRTCDLEHFLDDFITTGPPGTEECSHNLSLLVHICKLPWPFTNRKGHPVAWYSSE